MSRLMRSAGFAGGCKSFFLLLVLLGAGLTGLTGPSGAEDGPRVAAHPPGTIRFISQNTFATAKGFFHRWRLVDSQVDLGDLTKTSATVVVDLSSIDTGIERRDDHLRDPDFFDIPRFPTATVRVRAAGSPARSDGGGARLDALFDIELHGVRATAPGELFLVGTSPVVFEGRVVVDRTIFGVGPAPKRWSPMSIDAEVAVTFRVALDEGPAPLAPDAGGELRPTEGRGEGRPAAGE